MYGSLGALSDFSDKLILWAYERQNLCDPSNGPYYFDCLAHIAHGRKSEDLQTEVATKRSSGLATMTDVREAYKTLALPSDTRDVAHIIGTYKSTLQDSPKQSVPLREALEVIGNYLQNAEILSAASRSTMDIATANDKLSITNDTDASTIMTIIPYVVCPSANLLQCKRR